MTNKHIEKMPDASESYWLNSTELPTFPSLTEDRKADVVITGGGISGIMTAYQLTRKGYRIALIEADRMLNGTTGFTTAKLTAQHGLIYDHLLQHNGEETARQFYEANTEAVQYVRTLIEEKGIDCDFSEEPAYVFAEDEEQKEKVVKEGEAYQKLGIDGEFVHTLPLEIEHLGAVVMNRQAQFNPVKFLKPLIEEIITQGGEVFENTRVTDIEPNPRPSAVTREGHKVEGDYLVVCSHYPFYDKEGYYYARLSPSRSYSIAAETTGDYPGGMYVNAGQPARSLRCIHADGKKMVLAGGYGHPIGHKQNTEENYSKLYEFTDQVFGIENVPYRWSSQDPGTLDQIPYIGKYSTEMNNVFVATGYRKWGMSSGVLAGRLLTDLISGEGSKYEEMFSPLRPISEPNMKQLTQTSFHAGKMFAEDKAEEPKGRFADLQTDEGKVVKYNEQRAGAYRDRQGSLHVVDTTCTHMGCETHWNNSERTWDCPCHGSRFSYNGEVVEGPATKPLKRLFDGAQPIDSLE
ncbi:FAD-dependent oxidoreductase [Planococcus lenghuensis]|uniref:(2Fe-2S)-binding protein n=1 Tax=Planococcus lenghuensis TaxID=2213202 RepID=A0A1Q2L2E4_9BACL|nr:FAD-dependent oxidoreductase [Planococcus lenghuensis]AQQ54611.1 (2Fe-2S)-binding protein [Planococcus lenghuensis]